MCISNILCCFVVLHSLRAEPRHNSSFTQAYESTKLSELKTRAESGDLAAQYELGMIYMMGKKIAKDSKEAVKWWTKAASKGHPESQESLGVCYYYGDGILQNFAEAVKWYRKSAEQGLPSAQIRLAISISRGEGTNQNMSESISWFQKASNSGNTDGQYWLGQIYYNGIGVPENKNLGIDWLTKAAQSGHLESQLELGNIYTKDVAGRSNDKLEKVISWLMPLAQKGNASAQAMVGMCYKMQVEPLPRNHDDKRLKIAFEWSEKAAKKGHPEAQAAIGSAYLYGKGVQKNEKDAYLWLSIAIENGVGEKDKWDKIRQTVGKKLYQADLEECNAILADSKEQIEAKHKNDERPPYRIIKYGTRHTQYKQQKSDEAKAKQEEYYAKKEQEHKETIFKFGRNFAQLKDKIRTNKVERHEISQIIGNHQLYSYNSVYSPILTKEFPNMKSEILEMIYSIKDIKIYCITLREHGGYFMPESEVRAILLKNEPRLRVETIAAGHQYISAERMLNQKRIALQNSGRRLEGGSPEIIALNQWFSSYFKPVADQWALCMQAYIACTDEATFRSLILENGLGSIIK